MGFQLPSLNVDISTWNTQRAAWIAAAEECLYGTAPEGVSARGEVLKREPLPGGQIVKETVRITGAPDAGWHFDVTLFVPSASGRHPAITWNLFSKKDFDSCPIDEAVAGRGCIVAGFVRDEVWEDRAGGDSPLRDAYPDCTWGAIRAWAWAQARVADYLLTRADVDPQKLVCTGFSRGGKVALCCGIFDERYAVTVPVCSGAGGCGCFRFLGDRRSFCQDVTKVESLGRIGSVFPFWWTEAFSRFWPSPDPTQMGLEDSLPFDSHTLKALIAPRALFSLEGLGDAWSNPRGTALTWRAAQEAFNRLGGENCVRFREGGHAFSQDDWRVLLDFCDRKFAGNAPDPAWNSCPFPEI
ncbi:MAG: hypothetical protein IJ083_10820 [Clostridia bacterium]|nr:hypothetical protein [Clostridia bacterium]